MRWIGVFLLLVLTCLIVKQGIVLWSLGTDVDGDGIGLTFLGLEINDRIPEANIPNYAIGFFIASAFSALYALVIIRKSITKHTAKN
jgi:hypothetical protein